MDYCKSLLLIIGVVVVSFILGNANTFAEPPATSLVIERFPAEVGNSWEYKRTFYLITYDTTFTDTLEEFLLLDSLHSEFLSIDTLRGWECYKYCSQLFEDGDTFSDTVWFAHPDTAFLAIAYTPPTHTGPPWKITPTPKLKFGERDFNSVKELSRYLYQIRNSRLTSTYSETTFWDPPKKLFIFPLTVGKSWISMTDPWEEEREVVKEESVHVPAGDFLTLKIEMRPDLKGVELYQWISDQGIIKDSAYFDRIVVTDYIGDTIGYGVSYDKYELLSHQTTDVKGTDSENGKPGDFSLGQNYPNPFNPVTSIQYTVGSKQTPIHEKAVHGSQFIVHSPIHTSLKIYNILGQKVRTLVDGSKRGGSYKVIWDGKDDLGKEVASGIYFYQLKTGDFTETKKMLLLK